MPPGGDGACWGRIPGGSARAVWALSQTGPLATADQVRPQTRVASYQSAISRGQVLHRDESFMLGAPLGLASKLLFLAPQAHDGGRQRGNHRGGSSMHGCSRRSLHGCSLAPGSPGTSGTYGSPGLTPALQMATGTAATAPAAADKGLLAARNAHLVLYALVGAGAEAGRAEGVGRAERVFRRGLPRGCIARAMHRCSLAPQACTMGGGSGGTKVPVPGAARARNFMHGANGAPSSAASAPMPLRRPRRARCGPAPRALGRRPPANQPHWPRSQGHSGVLTGGRRRRAPRQGRALAARVVRVPAARGRRGRRRDGDVREGHTRAVWRVMTRCVNHVKKCEPS
jgi:hypothetical protein